MSENISKYSLDAPILPFEKPFADRANDWIAQSEQNNSQVLTPFLNPRERKIVGQLIKKAKGWQIFENGGFESAEQKRIIIAPKALAPEFENFELALVQINFNHQYGHLKHSGILGSIVHNGLKRELIGDIIFDGNNWQLITTPYITRILQTQIEKIGNTQVEFESINFAYIIDNNDQFETEKMTISSLRLDAFVASIYKLSRDEASDLIKAGDVKINFIKADSITDNVNYLDLISVRRHGRVKINSKYQTNKNGKIVVEILRMRR